MEAYEKPATSREKASEAYAESRCINRSIESCEVNKESGSTRRKNKPILSKEEEYERLARWLRKGETWLPQRLKNIDLEEN